MATRAILRIIFIALLLGGNVNADNGSTLPSTKASVVIPLLKKITPKDGLPRIEQILGKVEPGLCGAGQMQCGYLLDDKSVVQVSFYDMQPPGRQGIASIMLWKAGKLWETLYVDPRPWP